jgi:hypothetical protein
MFTFDAADLAQSPTLSGSGHRPHDRPELGWGLPNALQHPAQRDTSDTVAMVVAIGHADAKVYHIDLISGHVSVTAIRRQPPPIRRRHPAHKDVVHGAPADAAFHDRIAASIACGGSIVVVGHGTGQNNAALHLTEYLHAHDRDIWQRITREIAVELSDATTPQLLGLGAQAPRH